MFSIIVFAAVGLCCFRFLGWFDGCFVLIMLVICFVVWCVVWIVCCYLCLDGFFGLVLFVYLMFARFCVQHCVLLVLSLRLRVIVLFIFNSVVIALFELKCLILFVFKLFWVVCRVCFVTGLVLVCVIVMWFVFSVVICSSVVMFLCLVYFWLFVLCLRFVWFGFA